MSELDLTIVRNGKKLRGPFKLHMGLEEVLNFFDQAQGQELSVANQYRMLVQKALKNGNGKCVYTEGEVEKMDTELGGAKIIELAMRAQDECGLSNLTALNEMVDNAEKKSKRGRK